MSCKPVIVAFDVETTGLVAGVDRVVELGAVAFQGDEVLDTFSRLVNPGVPMPPAAGRVNGITDEMLAEAPPRPRRSRRSSPFSAAGRRLLTMLPSTSASWALKRKRQACPHRAVPCWTPAGWPGGHFQEDSATAWGISRATFAWKCRARTGPLRTRTRAAGFSRPVSASSPGD